MFLAEKRGVFVLKSVLESCSVVGLKGRKENIQFNRADLCKDGTE
jgi:hypothetical protein